MNNVIDVLIRLFKELFLISSLFIFLIFLYAFGFNDFGILILFPFYFQGCLFFGLCYLIFKGVYYENL